MSPHMNVSGKLVFSRSLAEKGKEGSRKIKTALPHFGL